MNTLVCKSCLVEKPLDDFYPHRNTKNGRMQPCKSCHIKRQALYLARRKSADPDAYFAQKLKDSRNFRASHANNPIWRAHVVAVKQTWHATNQIHNAMVRKQWRANNPEKVKAQKKRHYRKHAATIIQHAKRWGQNNPAKKAILNAQQRIRRRALIKALPHTFTNEQSQFMFQYWHFACAVCGREEGFEWKLVPDHWVPLVSPDCPGTVATNLIPLCHGTGGCNNKKMDKPGRIWLQEEFGPQKAARIVKRITAYFISVRERFEKEVA